MDSIKKIRKTIDGIAQVTERLKPSKSFYLSVDADDLNGDKVTYPVLASTDQVNPSTIIRCYESLYLAKAWCGILLGELGGTTPYQNDGKRKEEKDIEPTHDRVDVNAWEERNGWAALNHVQKVDTLRQIIQNKLIADIQGWFPSEGIKVSRTANIARTNIETHLIEAKFQLGFELARIKEESEKPAVDIETPIYNGIKETK